MSGEGPVEILLIEDGDADAEMTLRALRKGGVTNKTLRVRDGVEGLEFIFREGPYAGREPTLPKLILLDLKMPRLGGADVLRRIKGNETTKHLPIVMLTSSGEERDLVQCYQLGVNSYLVKPVDVEEFGKLVAHAGMYWVVMNQS